VPAHHGADPSRIRRAACADELGQLRKYPWPEHSRGHELVTVVAVRRRRRRAWAKELGEQRVEELRSILIDLHDTSNL
jgi:hypothetical protein